MVKTRNQADEDVDTFVSLSGRQTRRHNYNLDINGYESDLEEPSSHRPHSSPRQDFSSEAKPTRLSNRRRQTLEPQKNYAGPSHYNGMMYDDGVRRSTRQRRLTYDTFNQSLIEKHLAIVSELQEEQDRIEHERRFRRKRTHIEVEPLTEDDEEEGMDMYSRIKRTRRSTRSTFNMREQESKDSQESGSDTSATEEDNEGGNGEQKEDEGKGEEAEEEEEEESIDQQEQRKYYLREHKPRTILYTAPVEEVKKKKPQDIFRDSTPPKTRHSMRHTSYQSPAQRKNRNRRRRKPAFHGGSSTSSSSSNESGDDERRFEMRKSKSMSKARNRCLPMNLNSEDVATGIIRDRAKIGSSLADIDPMSLDKTVSFESVGGLGKHIQALKEMIVFPLLYPEIFEKFHIDPPRGCLFYGPPGTGKTLVARALANECSRGDRKVAFFMRKGADCLSKWVGESERQLRLLFDQAYQMRPSIIFFDEIDGLAPVRSSRQDQIHSSIVSTLLALMDGLDNRGEIVVIGATNRIDSIDPALRRPGRFDREFLFPLPSAQARKQILEIHTKQWNPPLSSDFLEELGDKCVGYCGADLRSLCTEAALHGLRRRYPQIYTSSDKLELDVSSIQLSARDFYRAMQKIIPASQRCVRSPGRALTISIRPLLLALFGSSLDLLRKSFLSSVSKYSSKQNQGTLAKKASAAFGSGDGDLELYSDDDEDEQCIYDTGRSNSARNSQLMTCRAFVSKNSYYRPMTFRPRLLLAGERGQGQSVHLGPALLYDMESLPVYTLDLPALYAVSVKTPEESCAQVFQEAQRSSPSIVYLPHINQWWDVINETIRATFLTLLQDLDPSSPVLLLATSDVPHHCLPHTVQSLFNANSGEVVHMRNPTEQERREFFEDLIFQQTKKPPPSKKKTVERMLEVLPKAKNEPNKLSEQELNRLRMQEDNTVRELRIFLRTVLHRLGRDRKYSIFAKPVDIEEVTDYYEIIKNPMDLFTMMNKVDLHKYQTADELLKDIDLICSNALEYNPDRDPQDRAIRHRACDLRDTAYAIVTTELDPEFDKMCKDILAQRQRRGDKGTEYVPDFYYVKPADRQKGQGQAQAEQAERMFPERFSRRVRGMAVSPARLAAEEAAAAAAAAADEEDESKELSGFEKDGLRMVVKKVPWKRTGKSSRSKSPWCKPSKKKYRRVIVYVDKYGNEVQIGDDKEKKEGDEEEEEEEGHMEEVEEEKENIDKREEGDTSQNQRLTRSGRNLTSPAPSGSTQRSRPTSPQSIRPLSPRSASPPQLSPQILQDGEPQSTVSTRRRTRSLEHKPEDIQDNSSDEVILKLPSYSRPTSPRAPVISPRQSSVQVRSHSNGPSPRQATHSPRQSMVSPRQGALSPRMMTAHSPRQGGHSPRQENMSPKQDGSPGSNARNPPWTRTSDSCRTSESLSEKCEKSSSSDKHSPSTKSSEMTVDVEKLENSAKKSVESSAKKPEESSSNETEENIEEEAETSMPRITRARTQSFSHKSDLLMMLAEPQQRLVIDEEKLPALLDLAVAVTKGQTVEKLEMLWSRLSQNIFHHRLEYDKGELVEELENTIRSFR